MGISYLDVRSVLELRTDGCNNLLAVVFMIKSIGVGKHIRVAMKTNGRWFILTAYLTRRVIGKLHEL